MKILGKGLLFFAAMSLGLSSCSDESPWSGSDSEGGINLNFSSDARVMRQTRADDAVSPVVPDASQFNVRLAKSDGSYSKKWASVESFNRESAFPIGDYTISAAYGDIEKEGFELPCFQGSTSVHVSPGETTDVSIVATLANAMVSVRYTDAFMENFSAYSAAVQSEGHDIVVFAQSETRPAYVFPSKVNLNLTLTNLNGDKVTIQPATFDAAPRHHYVVTVGVTGNTTSGDLALDVVFDDDVVAEVVNVSLGDELYSAPAPSIKAWGFNPDTAFECVETEKTDSPAEFHIFSLGGLKSANLNVISTKNYVPAFGRTVQLVNADALTQSQLDSEGVQCAGLFKNVDKMAVVNVTDFIGKLPADEYTLEVTAVDALTRVSEPMQMTIKVNPLTFTIETVENVKMLADEVKVAVNTNSKAAASNVKFQVPNANNQLVDAKILNVEENTNLRAVGYSYIYTLAIEPQIRDFIDVKATLANRSPEYVKVPMVIPEYTVETDAFARKVVLRLNSSSESETKAIADNLVFYNGEKQIPTANISIGGNGYITIVGLIPDTDYNALTAHLGSTSKTIDAFKTEAETNVPNGDFSAITETLNIPKIATGGIWTGSVGITKDYQSYSKIERFTPDGWANLNNLTCYGGSETQNTWFLVPSTFVLNGQTLIRSVGYSHNGKVPDKYKKTGVYYCQNAPAESEFSKLAGELFLGSYNFDGNESRVDGIDWVTRPSSLTFDYTYSPQNNEEAEVYIKIMSATGAVIAENIGYLSASESAKTVTLKLANYPFKEKAAKILLGFKSTKSSVIPYIHIPSGTELNDGYYNALNFTKANSTINDANTYKAEAIGSVLKVDNVKLGYETGATANTIVRTPRKNSKRK